MFGGFNVAKCETTCRLALGRFKLIRNKKNIQMKQSRKEIADLLKSGKQEYARIRVEGIIRENLLLQAYEILELYLELLTVRTQLMAKTKEIPRDMIEAVSSIIYASQRVSDMPELTTLRQLLAAKYGKEYALEASADATASKWQVNHNLVRCLLVEPPQPEEKLATLSDIAQEHGIEWDLSSAARDMALMPPAAAPIAAVNSIGGPGAGGYAAAPMPAVPHHPAPVMLGQQAPGVHGQYATPQQAAQAAAMAAAQAKAAADYAAQYANLGPHAQPPAVPAPAAAPPPVTSVPSQGWLVDPSGSSSGPQQPSLPAVPGGQDPHFPAMHAPPPTLGQAPGGYGGAPSAAAGPPPAGDTARNMEEVQRAYDAALGPPTKGEITSPAAPSAPIRQDLPAPPPSMPPSVPPAAAGGVAGGAKPPPPPAAVDEYEELTRRLEALKRS